ncbi:MAG TPA: hypothetical protein ENN18_00240 [Proteobacteria bacterium]|nr:hypothetical protein [Pseudomonadota bacterium]
MQKHLDTHIPIRVEIRLMERKSSIQKWILLLIIALTAGLVFAAARPDGVTSGTYCNPYSVEQVKKMMRFHGTLAAKFDGQTWWYKSRGHWLRLDNAEARRRCCI